MAKSDIEQTITLKNDTIIGYRKLFAVITIAVCMSAVMITLLIVRPEGLDLMDALIRIGGSFTALKIVFSGANLYEHSQSGGLDKARLE